MRLTLHNWIYPLALCLLFTSQGQAAKSFIEYSKLVSSDTLHDMNGLGFYTIFKHAADHQYYAGIDIALFQVSSLVDSEIATRVLIGVSGTGTFSPYAEIGTGLFDLLFPGNNNSNNCDQQRSCKPDIHFRAGLRLNLTSHVTLGVFYEGVRFGEFQDTLNGSHGYTGVTVGVRY